MLYFSKIKKIVAFYVSESLPQTCSTSHMVPSLAYPLIVILMKQEALNGLTTMAGISVTGQ